MSKTWEEIENSRQQFCNQVQLYYKFAFMSSQNIPVFKITEMFILTSK